MRLKELDSLRGLASLTVLIGHFIGVYPWIEQNTYDQGLTALNLLKYTPLHVFWAGHEAVILFFILSGFVLSLPFFHGKVKYIPFLVKRICRIFVPYFGALILSLLGLSMFNGIRNPQLSNWFNGLWQSSLTSGDIINHFLLIGFFDATKLDNPIWSLVHEMRISIILPLVVIIIVLGRNWKVSLFVGGVLSIGASSVYRVFPVQYIQSVMLTLQYILMFVIGAILANNYKGIVCKYNALGLFGKTSLGLVALMSYTYSWLFYGQKLLHRAFINDWVIAFGASIFIIMALSNNKFLLLRPIKFLGNISYSLYLLHIPILIVVMRTCPSWFPIWLSLLIAFVLSLIFANIFFLYLEKPSIVLGKRIVNRVSKNSLVRVKG